MSALSANQKKIAESFGIRPDRFARSRARLLGSQDTHGLTANQLKIAQSTGVSPRAFAQALKDQGGRSSAVASRTTGGDAPGLLRAHQEVDRAHKATYDAGWQVSAENTSDPELLDGAISALKEYDPKKDDDENYERLLDGAVYVMRLLNRAAPNYADTKDIKK